MTTIVPIGKYLDKNVNIASTNLESLQLPTGSLHAMVVFVSIDAPMLPDILADRCISGLLATRPLTLVFYGRGSEALVEKFIQYLNQNPQKEFTFVLHSHESRLEDALEDFFISAWPPQERWDDWKEYLVLVLGGIGLEEIHATVGKFVTT